MRIVKKIVRRINNVDKVPEGYRCEKSYTGKHSIIKIHGGISPFCKYCNKDIDYNGKEDPNVVEKWMGF